MTMHVIQTAAGSKLKAELEQMIRDGLDDIGNGYNSLEDRVYRMEKGTGRPDGPETIMRRLMRLESRNLPYEQQAREAIAQAEDTVAQLTSIKGRIKILQTDISDHTTRIASLTKNFNEANARNQDSQAETNAILQRLVTRVNLLESKNQDLLDETDTSSFTTAQNLAEALLARLSSGDELKASTMAQLKTAVGSSGAVDAHPVASAASTRFSDTHLTDQEPAAQVRVPSKKRKRVVEQEAPSKPAKRAKPPAKEAGATPSSSAPVEKSPLAPARQLRTSTRGKKALYVFVPASTTTSLAPVEVADSPQPRRAAPYPSRGKANEARQPHDMAGSESSTQSSSQ